ncbi:hypothetical protein K2Z84_31875 [Candidatus Binatia bacterium]|nr:hypothetical protein [Candidatus Binatia bacterium]
MRRGAPLVASQVVGRSTGAALALTALLGIALASCQASPQQEKQNLQDRARSYLELKQKRDWVAIYDGLLDPELHEKLKRDAFLKRREAAFDVLNFSVVSAEEQEGGTGKVVAKIDAMIPVLNPKGGTTMLRKEMEESQKWVARDGRWYIRLES